MPTCARTFHPAKPPRSIGPTVPPQRFRRPDTIGHSVVTYIECHGAWRDPRIRPNPAPCGIRFTTDGNLLLHLRCHRDSTLGPPPDFHRSMECTRTTMPAYSARELKLVTPLHERKIMCEITVETRGGRMCISATFAPIKNQSFTRSKSQVACMNGQKKWN